MKYKMLLFMLLSFSVAFALPEPVGYVNDFAGILPDKATIEGILSEYEKNTTIEIAVVTLDELPEDHTTATYVVELFEQWGIGKKGEDNGILILIIENGTVGNRMRIELGYGIQGYITGAEAGRILDQAIPAYEQGFYQDAVLEIIQGLDEQLESYVPGERPVNYEVLDIILPMLPFIIFIVFMIIAGVAASQKCPNCNSRKIECDSNYCTCKKCGKKFKRKKSNFIFVPVGVGGSGGGGGFGGFGGGGSGGGGAGR